MSRNNRSKITAYKSSNYGSVQRNYSTKASSSMNPFGPMMAEETFLRNRWDCDDAEECCDDIYDVYAEDSDFLPKEGEELQSYHYSWQPCLELENNSELETRLRDQIYKMERAYKAMCFQAMKWHYLMEDVESNEQIKKMFKDMQMIRRLTGSDNV